MPQPQGDIQASSFGTPATTTKGEQTAFKKMGKKRSISSENAGKGSAKRARIQELVGSGEEVPVPIQRVGREQCAGIVVSDDSDSRVEV